MLKFKLPEKMEEMWVLAAKGLREIDIASKLGISKQAVNKALKEARNRLISMFLELAEIFNLNIIRINVEKGFMIAINPQINTRVYVLYVPKRGPRTILDIKPYSKTSELAKHCKLLINTAKELNIISHVEGELDKAVEKLIEKMEE